MLGASLPRVCANRDNLWVSTRIPGGAASVHEGRHCLLRCEFAVLRPALLSCRRCETGGMGDNLMGNLSSPGACNEMTETCPSTLWADAGGGSCTDTPRGESCWRSVGPHGECGFDAGGLSARFRKRLRAGALRSAGVHAAQRRSLRREARRRVGYPWIPLRSECEGMRRDQSSPGHFHKFMTESLPLCPPPRRGALRRGIPAGLDWRGARCLGRKGEYLRTRDSGRDIPMAVKGGEPKRTVESRPPPRYTLTPD